MSDSSPSIVRRFERFLEFVFYSGVELSVLGSPALLVLLYWPVYDIDPSSMAGLSTIIFGTLWLALFRGGYLPVGDYPRFGHFNSVPLRIGYYSATIYATTWLGAFGWRLSGSLAVAFFLPIGATWLAFAAFPKLWRGERVR